MIVLLTGESGCGKTMLCQRVVEWLKARGLDVAGVLTLPRFSNGEKIGMEVENARTGQRCALAERAAIGEGTANLAWKFNPAGVEWGARILRGATPCDVLVVDELGPLELIHNEGWVAAIDVLQARSYRDALVVVRPELLENFRARLQLDMPVLTVTPFRREELFEHIVHDLDPRMTAHSRE